MGRSLSLRAASRLISVTEGAVEGQEYVVGEQAEVVTLARRWGEVVGWSPGGGGGHGHGNKALQSELLSLVVT